MNASIRALALAATGACLALSPVFAGEAAIGDPAPDFTLTDINGQAHSLHDYKGRVVVLEWIDPECSFVQKHYVRSSNIPDTERAATAQGVVWLTINSAGPGMQGDFSGARLAAWLAKVKWAGTDYFRDLDGRVGHLYGATGTPELYIIDKDGILVYAGGIDSIASNDPADIPHAVNYVRLTLAELSAGEPVLKVHAPVYGCTIKYVGSSE